MSMDRVFKALADPTRREILRLLNQGEKTAGQLAEGFDISAPSMSHHFNVLKQADLISARRNGQQIHYSLNTTVFQDLMAVLFDLFQKDEEREGS
jgi:ArsR family transcriptional regulator, arsenate/arsenite/antimonite-responsive transcriptional repressor